MRAKAVTNITKAGFELKDVERHFSIDGAEEGAVFRSLYKQLGALLLNPILGPSSVPPTREALSKSAMHLHPVPFCGESQSLVDALHSKASLDECECPIDVAQARNQFVYVTHWVDYAHRSAFLSHAYI